MCARGAVFYRASAFNGDISKWDVSSVKNMGLSASTPARPLHLVFACPRALRVHMGIMGESGARTRGLGRFRLSLGLRQACVRVVQCSPKPRPSTATSRNGK
eukprot:COSAG01_NODE_1489_length_10133_cov_189.288120_3_plen_102_part_00